MMMSSTIPSAKYSRAGSPLRFRKASTAIDGLSAGGEVEDGIACRSGRLRLRDGSGRPVSLLPLHAEGTDGAHDVLERQFAQGLKLGLDPAVTASRTAREIRMPPGGASPWRRAAMFTASP